jgi:hypothetical protein
MSQYEVTFQIAASQGGHVRKVMVRARQSSEAICAAALKLDDERIDRWTLLKCVECSS